MMRKRFLVAGLLLTLFGGQAAQAETCPTIATGTCACTVGTSAVVCLNAKTTAPYRLIAIANQSATATISVTDNGLTPAVGAGGSWDIPPGTTRTWSSSNVVFVGPMTVISSASSTPVTVKGQ